jgi:hypothetical protein
VTIPCVLTGSPTFTKSQQYGGMDVRRAQEAQQLRDENTTLRKLVWRI